MSAMQELFYRLSAEDVRTRFFQHLTSLTDEAARHLCNVSYDDEMAFAAVVGPPEHERVVATASYYLDPATGLADVAYLVDPDWQAPGSGRCSMHASSSTRGHAGYAASAPTCSWATR